MAEGVKCQLADRNRYGLTLQQKELIGVSIATAAQLNHQQEEQHEKQEEGEVRVKPYKSLSLRPPPPPQGPPPGQQQEQQQEPRATAVGQEKCSGQGGRKIGERLERARGGAEGARIAASATTHSTTASMASAAATPTGNGGGRAAGAAAGLNDPIVRLDCLSFCSRGKPDHTFNENEEKDGPGGAGGRGTGTGTVVSTTTTAGATATTAAAIRLVRHGGGRRIIPVLPNVTIALEVGFRAPQDEQQQLQQWRPS